MRDDRETEDYEVGYKKPPKSHQFKKGVSGNPSGRAKKPSDFEAKFLRELSSPLTINENGKRKIITKDEGIGKQLINKALSGHLQSIRVVDNWRRQALERAVEQQRLADRPVEELTDAELTAIIRAELKKSTPDGADSR
jgi:hypothetical protein